MINIREKEIAALKESLVREELTEQAYNVWCEHRDVPLQFWSFTTNEWVDRGSSPEPPKWTGINCYRIKPIPKLRPWTAVEAVGKIVRKKGHPTWSLITAAGNEGCRVEGWEWMGFPWLRDEYEQPDGKPCGVSE
jgi:hypothetical protein